MFVTIGIMIVTAIIMGYSNHFVIIFDNCFVADIIMSNPWVYVMLCCLPHLCCLFWCLLI